MIVNKYKDDFNPNFEFHTLGLYCLWNLNNTLTRFFSQEIYERNKKLVKERYAYKAVRKETLHYLRTVYDKGKLPLFSSVEIEVINRCNGECPFCPVNRHTDPRKMKKMDEALFKKIMDELGELNYTGRLALHSNNEPFLDDRIIELTKYAREHVPNAFLYMFTNGTLLTLEKFREIIPYLDKIVIDNYDDDLKLHKNVKDIDKLCRKDRTLNKKVEIHVRKLHEVLYTRGGLSPNNDKKKTLDVPCILPYKQMVIRPDGKISLCCNDPYGTNTLADLNKMSLKEAWYSKRYAMIRKTLRKSRKYVKRCQYCDTLSRPDEY